MAEGGGSKEVDMADSDCVILSAQASNLTAAPRQFETAIAANVSCHCNR